MDLEKFKLDLALFAGVSIADINHNISDAIAAFSGLVDEEGALTIVAKNLGYNFPNQAKENGETPPMSTPTPALNPHYTFAELKNIDAAYKQEYKCVITKVEPPSAVTIQKTGETKDIQEIWISDGTAGMKFTIWSKVNGLKEGMGLEMKGAYIKKNEKGYPVLKVANPPKGTYSFTDTTDVVPHVYDPLAAAAPASSPASSPAGGIPEDDRAAMDKFFLYLWTKTADAVKTQINTTEALKHGFDLVNKWIMGDD